MAKAQVKDPPSVDEWAGDPHVRRLTDPRDAPVQLNIRVPWFYREQLTRIARERKVSFNRLIANAIVRAYPPERPE